MWSRSRSWTRRAAAAAIVLGAVAVADAGVIGVVGFQVYEDAHGSDHAEIANICLEIVRVDADSGRFDLYNRNTTGSAKIDQVFFEGGLADLIQNFAFSSSHSSAGVNFSDPSSQGNTGPQGTPPPPQWDDWFKSTKSGGSGAPKNPEINPGEVGSWTFDLSSTGSFAAILAGLPSDGVNTGRIAIHVASLQPELESVAAVTVPLPPAAWMGLGLLGVLGAAARVRRRRHRA